MREVRNASIKTQPFKWFMAFGTNRRVPQKADAMRIAEVKNGIPEDSWSNHFPGHKHIYISHHDWGRPCSCSALNSIVEGGPLMKYYKITLCCVTLDSLIDLFYTSTKYENQLVKWRLMCLNSHQSWTTFPKAPTDTSGMESPFISPLPSRERPKNFNAGSSFVPTIFWMCKNGLNLDTCWYI